MSEFVLVKGGTIVTAEQIIACDVLARDGTIVALGVDLPVDKETSVIDAEGLHVLPGIIDPHSHLWEAGFVSREDFRDSTESAVAGGITTIVEMPLTTPEILDVDRFAEKARLGERTSYVDFALHGGVRPGNLDKLESMWRAGAAAFKIFTCDTGCPMEGVINDRDLLDALTTIAAFDGLATFHAENEELLVANRERIDAAGRTDNAAFNDWRDETVELEAINRIMFYAERTGARVNIVHVTSPEGVAMIRRARERGVRATAETCPHYLYLTNKDIERRGSWATCAPPMRGEDARQAMIDLASSGAIATIGSDHGPVDPMLKRRGENNVFQGQPGLPGNETMVPLLFNLTNDGRMTVQRLAELTSEAPARLYGLYPRKGAIAVGSDADFTIADMSAEWTIAAEALVGKAGWTPYEGTKVQGRVVMTVIRGRVCARDGKATEEPGCGTFVPRSGAACDPNLS